MNLIVLGKRKKNIIYIALIIAIFFLISKNIIYTNGYTVQEKHRANPEKTSNKQTENEKEQNNNKSYKREREQRKEGRESLVVSLQARHQSKRVPLKEVRI